MAGQRRFIAKSFGHGRHTYWGVYDRVTGSWPVTRSDTGQVRQHMSTEAEAQAEADRCEEATK